MFDLIIRGGLVLDPASGLEEVRDVCIRGGVVAAICRTGEPSRGIREIRAEGCIVSPGFVDAHAHVNESSSDLGVRADIACPSGGVTTVIDAGSAGFSNFDTFYNRDILPSRTTIKAAFSPTEGGVQNHPDEELQDPDRATPEHLGPVFDRYAHVLAGIKIRVHQGVTRQHGLEALRQASATAAWLKARGHSCRLMIHFGKLAPGVTLKGVLALLDRGDVLTHIYRPDDGSTIFDGRGKLQDCVLAARERGVVFESGCARSHLSFESAKRAFAQGFWPQIISTDLVRATLFWEPSGWLALKMSIYLSLGMPLREVVRAVTQTPVEIYRLEGGSLALGKPADLTVFQVESRKKRLDDLYGGHLEMDKLIVPMATVKGGEVLFQQIYL